MTAATRAQVRALRHLMENSGEGAIDKTGFIVAAGERLKFMPETWLRLMTLRLVEPAGDLRIRVTDAGRQVAR